MTEREKIIDKIRKLKNLADPDKNTNENEIAAALEAARRLMLEHSISESETFVAHTYDEIGGSNESKLGTKKIPYWLHLLAMVIAEYFDCKHLRRRYKNIGCSYIFYGPKNQTECAAYAFDSVYKQVLRLSDSYKIDKTRHCGWKGNIGYAKVAKREYKDGLVTGLYNRCLALKRAEKTSDQAQNITALAIRSEEVAASWLEKNSPNAKSKNVYSSGCCTEDGHFEAGIEDSESLSIIKGEIDNR